MSDATKASEETAPAEQVNQPVPTPQEVAVKAEKPVVKNDNADDLVAHWKAMSRKNEDRAKENLEKLGAVEAENLRYKTALENSIPAEYMHLLNASDEDGLRAQAETVKTLLTKAAAAETAAPDVRYVVPSEGQKDTLALNGDGLEQSLRDALGIH